MKRILIANRGEIARRVMRTARRMGLQTVAVYSEADAGAPFVRDADLAVALQGNTSTDTYLNINAILDAAQRSGADAIHPGYGFLSENPDFAEAVHDAGLTWIGPTARSIRSMALKVEAKHLAAEAGVPLVPGAELPADASAATIQTLADEVGYPLLVKASAGGGGKGMRTVSTATEVVEAVAAARREADSAFGDATVFLERYLRGSRHVEVQVFGDTHGHVVHLYERDCSIQRRHQKIIEESPAPTLTRESAQAMFAAATALARVIGYEGAGTVEFLVAEGAAGQEFYFLEMNTRLQVEHAVTEAVTGMDLVEWQIRVARGEPLPLRQEDIARSGHAIEIRLYAEDPARGYLPNTGTLTDFSIPNNVRTDTGIEQGSVVSAFYDPMLAKVISHAPDRRTSIDIMVDALRRASISGLVTNRESLIAVLESPGFSTGDTPTDYLDHHPELLAPVLESATTHRHLVAAAVGVTPVGDVPVGWRNVAAVPETYRFTDAAGETRHEVQLSWTREGVEARCDDMIEPRVFIISHDTQSGLIPAPLPQSFTMVEAGIRHHYVVSVHAGWVSVSDGKQATQWQVVPRYADGAGPEAGASGPTTPVPGTVTLVEVSEGDIVTAGQCLVVLEAMKMEHRIIAEVDSVVAEVLVSVGQSVDAHTVVAVLTAVAPESAS